MQGKLTGLRDHGEKISLMIVKLKDVWKVAGRDAKTLSALCMYDGLRREGKLWAQNEHHPLVVFNACALHLDLTARPCRRQIPRSLATMLWKLSRCVLDFCTSIRLAVWIAVAVQSSSPTAEDVHMPYQSLPPDAGKVNENSSLLPYVVGQLWSTTRRQIVLLQRTFLELTKTKARLVEVSGQRQGTDNGAGFKHHWGNLLQDELIC